ncbi:oxidase EvaA [Kitasatospora sp. MAA19]|uniref:NDP-hexose 2,3-dehydratase family protein n=1 Tax=unclassified Kitasatospora TaxID=2633591 RepID=UPI0024754706|nr:NDP-hexose 2,3-dehydratase family protein [Kitasatospora sp. MAA19]MDH6709080.1 oxidase EvaA [Kitasatospora sp. MAA19]
MSTGALDSDGFLTSSLALSSPETSDPDLFLRERSAASSYRVDRVPLGALADWRLDDRLAHVSGRFFAIEGLAVQTDFGPVPQWFQPIIVQSEIGILGILVKRINGILHFLMQAKMEPGNSALVQYSATVQATPSNYQRVHRGRSTPYLDYFLHSNGRRIVFDQLLSEHASWYLHKRNRNMIVEIPADEDVAVGDDFVWMTLGQLRRQLALGNRVNMNARTVLACISYALADGRGGAGQLGSDFHSQVVGSHRTQRSDAEVSAVMSWLIDQKATFNLDVRRVSLRDLRDWTCDEDGIRHREGRYFDIVGQSVTATSREVSTWSQPMLEPKPGNTVAFLCQRRSGDLRFLVQAMVQPGSIDRLELAATVQLAPANNSGPHDLPPLADYLKPPESWIQVDNVQSEDGGRFSRADTRHLVVNVPEDHMVDAPDNYRWVSLGLLNRLIRSGYYVNVEARSLMACLL